MNMLIGGWWACVSMFIGGVLFPIIGLWTLIPLIAWAVYLITCECVLDTARLILRNVQAHGELTFLFKTFLSTVEFRVRETENEAAIDMRGFCTRWVQYDDAYQPDKVDSVVQSLYNHVDALLENGKAQETIRRVSRVVEPANPVINEEEK